MKKIYFFLLKPDHFWSFRAISKKRNLKENFKTTLDKIFIDFLEKTELNYYHQKVASSCRVASRVTERLRKSYQKDLRIVAN